MKKHLLLFFNLVFVLSHAQNVINLNPFPGASRDDAVAHYYKGKIFCGTGLSSSFTSLKDWWHYNINDDEWTKLDPVPFEKRQYVSSFQWKNYLYLFAGWENDQSFFNDLWRFNLDSFEWEEMAEFPGSKRWAAGGFILNNKLYTGLGQDTNTFFNDWWEYDLYSDSWMSLKDFPGQARAKFIYTDINGFGLLGVGRNEVHSMNDFWLFNPFTKDWQNVDFNFQDSLSYVNYSVIQNNLILVSGQLNDKSYTKRSRVINFDHPQNPVILKEWTILRRRGGRLLADEAGELYLLWGLDSVNTRLNSLQKIELDIPLKTESVNLDLFPNPTSGNLLLQSKAGVGNVQFFNSLGQRVMEVNIDNSSSQLIDLSRLKSGYYYARYCEGDNCESAIQLLKY